jgi:hypothetical protein
LDDVAKLANTQVLARCFLETQEYDHSSWERFADVESAFLSNSDPSSWDEDWLRRLHLYNVVARDAARWATQLQREIHIESTDKLFSDLVQGSRTRLVRLFSSYASQDAGAAFRLAESCSVDLVIERPDLVARCCTEPPFLAIAIDRAERDADRAGKWALILAESGLRYGVVAKKLSERSVPRLWEPSLIARDSSRYWRLRFDEHVRAFNGTFYSACLSLARGEPEESLGLFPLVRKINSIRAPSSLESMLHRFLPISIPILLSIPIFLLINATLQEGAGSVDKEKLPQIIVFYLLLPLPVATMQLFSGHSYSMVYRKIENFYPPIKTNRGKRASRHLIPGRVTRRILQRQMAILDEMEAERLGSTNGQLHVDVPRTLNSRR